MCPATVQDDTRISTYSYVVAGKQSTVDFAAMLAAAGIEAGRPVAPPELWRAFFDKCPIETLSHPNPTDPKSYLSTGLRDIEIRWSVFDQVWGQTDLQYFAEEDAELMCAIQDLRATSAKSVNFPPARAYLAGKVMDAFLPTISECTVTVDGETIRLDPVPTVGKVRISKDKLDGTAYDVKGENPRLERIQRVTLLASQQDLHAEARRGSVNPKDDRDVNHGDKTSCRCPLPSHPDETASAWVQMYEDGFGGGCACGGFASNYPSIIRAYNPRLSRDQSYDRAEQILGLPPWGQVSAGEIVVGDELQALAALAPAPPPAPVPTVNHIVSWLRKQLAVGVAEESWMVSRALNPAVQARCILSRSPAPRTTPSWDGNEIGDEAYLAEAAENAAKTGHTLITLTFDEKYQPAGVRFRRTLGAHKAKAKTPTVYRNKKLISMPQRGVGLNNVAVRAGQGKTPWPEWTVIVEGEPDMRTAAELYPAAAVIEIHRGKNAWTKAFADTLPSGIKVAILTDTDKIGRKYRRDVIRSLGKRVQFYDFPGRVHDLNQLLMDGKQADLDLVNLKQIPVGEEREHTDLGNAHRLHDEYFGELAYAAGRWYVLNDGVWAQQDKDAIEVRRRIQAIAEGIVEEAEIVASEEGAKATLWWGKKSQSSGAVTACLTEAKVLFSVGEDVFDKDPFLLGTGNGVVDLRTGELLEDPGAALVSRRVPIVFEPSATCPRWLRFLAEIFLGDQELIGYMRRTVGYFMTSSCREQKFWLWHGHQGGNGKGTFLGVCQKLLGTYAAPFRTSLLCRRPGQAGWDLSALEGLKLAYLNEKDDDTSGKVSVETLKNLASEDTLYGEKKRQDPRPFQPTHKIVWALNAIPPLPHDPALFRRLQLVPFLAHFPKPDDKLAATLEGELTGILAWAVQGAVEWYRDGLQPPQVVQAGGQDLLEEADVVGRWITAECVVDPSASTERTRLHDHFTAWASAAKVRSQGASEFYVELERKGFKKVRRGNDRVIRGIRLVPTDATPIEWGSPVIGQTVPTPEQIDTVVAAMESKKPN